MLAPPTRQSPKRIHVETKRLDVLLEGEQIETQIDLLDIDMFEHELSVVRSAGDLFHAQRSAGGLAAAASIRPVALETEPHAGARIRAVGSR